jgi:hypothetical protein
MATTLSRGIPFVRVDGYDLGDPQAMRPGGAIC